MKGIGKYYIKVIRMQQRNEKGNNIQVIPFKIAKLLDFSVSAARVAMKIFEIYKTQTVVDWRRS